MTWRQTRHAATATGKPAGTDPLLAMLSAWRKDEGLPSQSKLNEGQARRVLERIAELEWSGRPCTEAAG